MEVCPKRVFPDICLRLFPYSMTIEPQTAALSTISVHFFLSIFWLARLPHGFAICLFSNYFCALELKKAGLGSAPPLLAPLATRFAQPRSGPMPVLNRFSYQP